MDIEKARESITLLRNLFKVTRKIKSNPDIEEVIDEELKAKMLA